MRIICSIYKSPKQEGAYLYVEKSKGLSRVPATLLKHFGTPEQTMTLLLHKKRKLAIVDVNSVIEAVDKDGFFLQLPTAKEDDYMTDLHKKNSKY